jgi:hypothetical protein
MCRHRLIHGTPFFVLASYYMVNTSTATKAFLDILFYLLMKVLYLIFSLNSVIFQLLAQDPEGHLPNLFNDEELTDRELTLFLRNIKHRQSAGVQRVVNALQTPAGRPVINILYCILHYDRT